MSDKMKTILVFKTSVVSHEQVGQLSPYLNRLINTNGRWNFDLEDCDNIFRVETESLEVSRIATLFRSKGFLCEELY